MADQSRKDARTEVHGFIKEWPESIEIHADAHIKRNKEKSVINQTNAKSEFALKGLPIISFPSSEA